MEMSWGQGKCNETYTGTVKSNAVKFTACLHQGNHDKVEAGYNRDLVACFKCNIQ